jgi:hypothetical protein
MGVFLRLFPFLQCQMGRILVEHQTSGGVGDGNALSQRDEDWANGLIMLIAQSVSHVRRGPSA